VLDKFRLVAWGVNSIVVAAGATLVGLAVSIPAAYAFAKMRFRGQQWLFLLILSTILVPVHITIVPLFLGLAKLKLTDTYFSLIMPTVANGFGVFLLRQFFQGIPKELEEAAVLDGASRLGILLRVVLPLSRPPIMAVAIFLFIQSWNDFMWPLIVTNTDATRTLPVGLASSLAGTVSGGGDRLLRDEYGRVGAGHGAGAPHLCPPATVLRPGDCPHGAQGVGPPPAGRRRVTRCR